MQTDIRNRSQLVKVVDCLEWHLNQISANAPYVGAQTPNGFFITDGVVVDRTTDRRAMTQESTDKIQGYREKGALVSIIAGDTTLEDGSRLGHRGTLGGNRRYEQIIDFLVHQTLSKDQIDAGVTPDMLVDWLRMDLTWGILYRDQSLAIAATQLNIKDNWWGKGPSYFNPQVTKVQRNPLIRWPHVQWVLRLAFQFDETAPLGAAGIL